MESDKNTSIKQLIETIETAVYYVQGEHNIAFQKYKIYRYKDKEFYYNATNLGLKSQNVGLSYKAKITYIYICFFFAATYVGRELREKATSSTP